MRGYSPNIIQVWLLVLSISSVEKRVESKFLDWYYTSAVYAAKNIFLD